MILISIQVRELEVAANLCKRGFALILLEETRLVLVEFIELAPKVIKVEGVVLYGICFGLLRALGSTLWSWHMAVSQSKGKTTFEIKMIIHLKSEVIYKNNKNKHYVKNF